MLAQARNAARPHHMWQASPTVPTLFCVACTPVILSVDMVRVLIKFKRCFCCVRDVSLTLIMNPSLGVHISSMGLYVMYFYVCLFSRCVVPRPGDHGGRHPLPRRAQWHNPESVLCRFQHATGATFPVSRNL